MTQRIENTGGEMAESDRRQFQYTHRMLVLYFALTFVITWGILIPALSTVPEDRQTRYLIPAAFGPFLSAAITIWISKGGTAHNIGSDQANKLIIHGKSLKIML